MLHLLGVAGQFANDILLLHRSRLGLPMGHLLRALLHTATIKFSLQTFHSLRVIYLGDIRSLLILNIDLIQNHLLAVLWLLSLKLIMRSLALLTRPIYTYISRHAIVGLVVGVVLLRTYAILLNYRMSLVRSSAHVVAHKVGAVVYQFLFSLWLDAIVASAWAARPTLINNTRLIRFIRLYAFLIALGIGRHLLARSFVHCQQLLLFLKL